jgi:predicted RNase H-like HicB family nuclease
MKTYIALFEYDTEKKGFSVVFPDLPGFITAGDNYEETLQMAHEGLSSHIQFLREETEFVPEPRTLEQIQKTWNEWDEWEKNYKFMVVPVALLPIITKSKRINVVINEGLLAKIDMVAKNRSEYISRAVENTFR